MPEPQGSAPVVGNHGKESYSLKGVKAGVSASRLDQTDNKGRAESAAQKTSQISKESHG